MHLATHDAVGGLIASEASSLKLKENNDALSKQATLLLDQTTLRRPIFPVDQVWNKISAIIANTDLVASTFSQEWSC